MSDGAERPAKPTQRVIDLPFTYTNGFSINTSNADISLLLLLNGQPQAGVSMSFTTAKSLAKQLNESIARLEEASGYEIQDIDFFARAIDKITRTTSK